MSDEYTIHTNYQRASDDPRAEAEYEHRMQRVREAQDELLELAEEAARETERRVALRRASEAASELAATKRRATMHVVKETEQ